MGSFSTFATVECENALNDLVQYTDSVGQIKAYILRNNVKIQTHTNYLQLLNDNQTLNDIMGYTREELVKINNEDVEANKSLVESLLDSPQLIEHFKNIVKSACKQG